MVVIFLLDSLSPLHPYENFWWSSWKPVPGTLFLFDSFVEYDYSLVMDVAQWDGCDVTIVKDEVTRDVFHVTAQVEIGRLMRTVTGMWSPAGNAREREGNGKSPISFINMLSSFHYTQLPE